MAQKKLIPDVKRFSENAFSPYFPEVAIWEVIRRRPSTSQIAFLVRIDVYSL
jgi:hypothetical protein